jgi:hypothetical protein
VHRPWPTISQREGGRQLSDQGVGVLQISRRTFSRPALSASRYSRARGSASARRTSSLSTRRRGRPNQPSNGCRPRSRDGRSPRAPTDRPSARWCRRSARPLSTLGRCALHGTGSVRFAASTSAKVRGSVGGLLHPAVSSLCLCLAASSCPITNQTPVTHATAPKRAIVVRTGGHNQRAKGHVFSGQVSWRDSGMLSLAGTMI